MTISAAPAVRNVYRNVDATSNQAPAVRKVYKTNLRGVHKEINVIVCS